MWSERNFNRIMQNSQEKPLRTFDSKASIPA